MSIVTEAAFEDHIVNWLVDHGGYQRVKVGNVGPEPRDFDAVAGLDTADLFEFIGATQGEVWNRLIAAGYGGDANAAQSGFVQRLASELDKRGTVDVLRRGVVDRNNKIKLAFFNPAHGLTPELVAQYEANVLTVTRQLPFESGSGQTIDLAFMVNGIPVATAELKNPLTGPTVENAIAQYRKDRDPKNRTLKRLGMVHFAVDPSSVAMTTHLAGNRTRFLPFNRGHNLGAGNPANPDGHRTAYLWERVWSRDAWMDILDRFIHVEKPSRGSKKRPTVIFPRFHQWNAVRRLEADARTNGAGRNYLVQHSAGSGKSNSIAWLAHRLSSLHNNYDEKVFNKVVVITDRLILDRQLQDTISQFEHPTGVIERIDKSSTQLAEALTGEQARIIITTLQKFPFIFDKIAELPDRTYAVIIDEAHSSQTGEAAKELRRALGRAGADLADEATDAETLLAEAVAARGHQPNLSFFAFTATPKGRTLELFGNLNPDSRHEPFDLYPMRQAIEEDFIKDVLAKYVTYNQYLKIEKAILDNPLYETAKARSALARFITLHPENMAQKAEIIIEHYKEKIARQIGGKAKAMVVCSSRSHAVRMYQQLRKYVTDHGHDIGVLVAFSGDVDGLTESKANGFPETRTAKEFDTDDWRIMVVAEKFQTGFDQPKLAAMYVDKTLTGLAAVQTLSRLNRIHPDKSGTFVLDFVNDANQIRDSFAVYHGKTIAPPTDPNLLFDTRHDLNAFHVLDLGEMQRTAELLIGEGTHDRIDAALQPAVDRFHGLEDNDREAFRDALTRFVRTYGFLAHIVPFGNSDLERDYLYCRALAALIRRPPGQGINLGSEVELTHLRHEMTFEGSISLPGGVGEVVTVTGGAGPAQDPDEETLSEVIARFNEHYGTDFTDEDQLIFEAAAGDLVDDPKLQNQATNNDETTFRDHIFPARYQKALLERRDRNYDLIHQYLDRGDFRDSIREVCAVDVQKRATVAGQRTCPISDLLGPDRESLYLEYKYTLRWDIKKQAKSGIPEDAVIKTIAGFANARYGGTLLVGVAEDGTIHGLESDYATFSQRGHRGEHELWEHDLWGLHLQNLIRCRLGDAVLDLVTWQFHTNGNDLARISIEPAGFPLYERKGNTEIYWHRTPLATISVTDPEERGRIVARRV